MRQPSFRLPSKLVSFLITPMRFPQLPSEAAWDAAMPFVVEFLNVFDFRGMTVTQALRSVLDHTGLPTSTRSVCFLLRSIAKKYLVTVVEPAPTAWPNNNFTDRGSIYMLMYSAMILNGDLQAPAIKPQHKMRRDVFIRNHRGACRADVTLCLLCMPSCVSTVAHVAMCASVQA
jgi:hypothetical protein